MSESIFQSKCSTIEINGREFDFYPTRLPQVLKLRKFSEDLARGVMGVMTKDPSNYIGRTFKGDETIINDISQDKVDQFTAAKSEGIQTIIHTLLEEKNMDTLLELICDSMRTESFTPKELKEDGDLEYLVHMAMGLFEANSSVVDPILGKIQSVGGLETEENLPEKS